MEGQRYALTAIAFGLDEEDSLTLVEVRTAWRSNFEEVAQCPFTDEVAILYLKALTEPAKSRVLDYLQKAPPEVMTPVRAAAILCFIHVSPGGELERLAKDLRGGQKPILPLL